MKNIKIKYSERGERKKEKEREVKENKGRREGRKEGRDLIVFKIQTMPNTLFAILTLQSNLQITNEETVNSSCQHHFD